MHLPTIRARRNIQLQLDRRLELAETRHPRDVAIDWIREKIRLGKAGLDAYDPAVFVLVSSLNETIWANTCLELVGEVLTRVDQIGGGQRLRAVLEADARLALELDIASSATPWMLDEPLASRSVESTSGRMELLLGSLDPERESSEAIRRAHAAFESRQSAS